MSGHGRRKYCNGAAVGRTKVPTRQTNPVMSAWAENIANSDKKGVIDRHEKTPLYILSDIADLVRSLAGFMQFSDAVRWISKKILQPPMLSVWLRVRRAREIKTKHDNLKIRQPWGDFKLLPFPSFFALGKAWKQGKVMQMKIPLWHIRAKNLIEKAAATHHIRRSCLVLMWHGNEFDIQCVC